MNKKFVELTGLDGKPVYVNRDLVALVRSPGNQSGDVAVVQFSEAFAINVRGRPKEDVAAILDQ